MAIRNCVSLGTSIAIITLDTGAYQSGWPAIDRQSRSNNNRSAVPIQSQNENNND
jgi:hypothetical protein